MLSPLKRGFIYLLGMVILAFGISLNAKTALGVSPIISSAYCVSLLTGLNFGNLAFVLYSLFVVAEVVIHLAQGMKKQAALDCLQVLVSLVFTRFLNVFQYFLPDLGAEELQGSLLGSLPVRVLFLLLAIVCTGVGAALSLDMRLVPNPGDGIVQTIADATHQGNGLVKNCVDISSVLVTCAIGLIAQRRIMGIGLGTLLAMLGVGRVIALFNRLTGERLAVSTE